MSQGFIFDIQRFCLNDGPGIRTVVFLKGCPLSCKWCCNPESQSYKPEIMFSAEKCIGCGICKDACRQAAISLNNNAPEIDRNKCVACGRCSEVCPSNALQLSGLKYSVKELVGELLKDKLYFEVSGGGVTISGGEPLAQPAFLAELLIELKQHGIHTTIETSGFANWDVFERIIDYTDLFFFDIKHMNQHDHKIATGVDNKRILKNFESLAQTEKSLIVRVPLIPEYNVGKKDMQNLIKYVNDHGVLNIELLPYHLLGQKKYSSLGREYKVTNLKIS